MPSIFVSGIRWASLNGPQATQVEDAAEVDVEGVGALAREERAVADLVHGLGRELGVVRRAALADVDRRAAQVAREHVGAVVLAAGHRVELRAVPRRRRRCS